MIKKLDNYVVSVDALLRDAIQSIDKNRSRCVIVINKDYKVLGVISDGDILRNILSGVDIYSPIRNSLNINFKFLHIYDKKAALEIIKSHGVSLIPILNENFILQDVITVDDLLMEV